MGDWHALTIRPIERSFMRVTPAVMVLAFFLGSIIFFQDLEASTRMYLSVVGALALVLFGVIVAYRHRGLARRAASRSEGRSGMVVLFERAAFAPSDDSEDPWRLDKGWLVLTPVGIEVWDGWGSRPLAVFSGRGATVEVIRGDALWRPVARFRLPGLGFVDAAVTRSGPADLRGWTTDEIVQLNQILLQDIDSARA